MNTTDQKNNISPYEVGILGGMGTLATASFLNILHWRTHAENDQEHINLVILNNPSIPDRSTLILANEKEPLLSELIKNLKILENLGIPFAVAPCNTLTFWQEEANQATTVELIDIIETAVEHTAKKYPDVTKVGILSTEGTREAKLYENIFEKFGVSCIYGNDASQEKCSTLIYDRIKAGNTLGTRELLSELMSEILETEAELVILGCTELSVIAARMNLPKECVDPMAILADYTIERTGRTLRKNH